MTNDEFRMTNGELKTVRGEEWSTEYTEYGVRVAAIPGLFELTYYR